jgi:DNA invertase Pin-like site-specific DNA recombinase
LPTQLANGERHAARRGWQVVARLKDDGYSAFKEIRRDDFVSLIEMIERDEIDVVIIATWTALPVTCRTGAVSRKRRSSTA